jgi:hypothetical protein
VRALSYPSDWCQVVSPSRPCESPRDAFTAPYREFGKFVISHIESITGLCDSFFIALFSFSMVAISFLEMRSVPPALET